MEYRDWWMRKLQTLFYDFPITQKYLSVQNLRGDGAPDSAGKTCPKCRKTFPNAYVQYNHSKHCQELLCRECNATRSDYGSLKTHVWIIHHFHIHRCKSCKYISFYETDEASHRSMSCSLRGQYECESCSGTLFAAFSTIQDHMLMRHTPNLVYGCNYCPYETHTKPGIRLHEKKHTTTLGLVRCPYCAWGSVATKEVVIHIGKYHIGR